MRGYVIKDEPAYRAQMAMAARVARIFHHKMMTAGFIWDGMDGYQAPPGFTEEDGDRLWQESLKEARG